MKCCVISIALLCLFACENREKAKVDDCFQTYLTSIVNSRGKEALACMDSRTKLYYQDLLDKTVNLSADKTRKLPIADMLTVLTARQKIPRDLLLSMSGEQFLIYAIDHGWVGKESVQGMEIAEVAFADTTAMVKVRKGDTVIPFGFPFYKEDGAWKINLTEMLQFANIPLQKLASQSGVDNALFVLQLVAQVSGAAPDPDLWNPVQ